MSFIGTFYNVYWYLKRKVRAIGHITYLDELLQLISSKFIAEYCFLDWIGYAELMYFYEIKKKNMPGIMTNKSWEILVFNMFFQWGPHNQHISHIFGYSNFKCNI